MSWIIFMWTFIHWNMAFNVLDHFKVNIYPLKYGFKCHGSFSSEHLSIELWVLMSWIIFKLTSIHRNFALNVLDHFQVNISIEIWLLKVLDPFQVNIYPLKYGFQCLGSVSSELLYIEMWLLMSWICFKWTFIHWNMAFDILEFRGFQIICRCF